MKRALLAVGLVLCLAGPASGAGNTVQATLNGKCVQVQKLDSLGALKSETNTCNASASCKCGGSTKLTYTITESDRGTGAHQKRSSIQFRHLRG